MGSDPASGRVARGVDDDQPEIPPARRPGDRLDVDAEIRRQVEDVDGATAVGRDVPGLRPPGTKGHDPVAVTQEGAVQEVQGLLRAMGDDHLVPQAPLLRSVPCARGDSQLVPLRCAPGGC